MVDLLSRSPMQALHVLEVRCATYDDWKAMYAEDLSFGKSWRALQQLIVINKTPFLDYTIHDGWLYKLKCMCVPQFEDHLILIREAHASSRGGHFETTKTILNIQHHFYQPTLPKQVEKFIFTCSIYSQSKPSNHKHGLYQPLLVPTQPWESISMDFLSGLPTTFCKHDAIWVVMCQFYNMALFIPCHKTTSVAQTIDLFFHHIWTHFGLPCSIIFDKESCFLSTFWHTLQSLLGFQLRFSTAFHPQTDGQTKVVNHTLVQSLCNYFAKNKQRDLYLPIIQHTPLLVSCPLKFVLGFNSSHPQRFPLLSLLVALHTKNRNNSQPNVLFTIQVSAILQYQLPCKQTKTVRNKGMISSACHYALLRMHVT